MNFNEAIAYVESAERFGSKLGLESITRLTGLLGNPQKGLNFIHVAGTNGKGSVSAFVSGILSEAGFKTGLFTSPHIESFNERMLIDGMEIEDEDAAEVVGIVKSKVDELLANGFPQPTEFEIVTAAALVYFNKKKCDFVVLEVGLGGRLDSTNVIDTPEVAVITSIDYDHVSILGSSLAKITFEKAGIIKTGGSVVTCAQHTEAEETLKRICTQRNAALYIAPPADIVEYSLDGQTFDYNTYYGLKITLLGEHQIKNAALAVKAVEALNEKGWKIHERAVREGLIKAKWPGRFEVIQKLPYVILDGAHNPQGARALARTLTGYFCNMKIFFIMGVLADKNYDEMLDATLPMASRFFTVTPDSPRSLPAASLAEIIKQRGMAAESFETVSDALKKALGAASANEVICCFGSLYFVGEARKILL